MLLETKLQGLCLVYTRLCQTAPAHASRCLVLPEFPPARPPGGAARAKAGGPAASSAKLRGLSPAPARCPHPRPPSARPRAVAALTLGDGDGLEAVQLPQQAAPLGGVQAVDEVAGSLCRIQRLHRLLLRVGAQRPPGRRRPPREELPLGAAPQAAQAAAAAAARRAPQRAQAGGGRHGSAGAPRPPQQQRRPAEPRRHGAGEGRGARAATSVRREVPPPGRGIRTQSPPRGRSRHSGGGAASRPPLHFAPLRAARAASAAAAHGPVPAAGRGAGRPAGAAPRRRGAGTAARPPAPPQGRAPTAPALRLGPEGATKLGWLFS